MKTFFAFVMVALLSLSQSAYAQKPLDVQILKTAAGIEVWLVEDHSLPVVTMNFSFEGGLINDPIDKPGVAKMVSILLDEGAGELRSQVFQSQLSNNAINLSFTPGRDAFHGTLKTVTKNRDLAFSLLQLALTQPRFDNDAVERMRDANLASIKDDMGNPAWLSARTFNGVVFEGHYYALPGAGTLESVPRITRRDLVDFVKTQFTLSGLRVSIVGDISKDEASLLIDKTFAALPATGPQKTDAQPAELQHQDKTIMLPLDTPQTYIATALPAVARNDANWHTAVVMNYILGGGSFDARLMREVREKRGLTYGIYSALLNMKYGNILQITLSTSNDKAQEALSVIRSELQRMANEGVTDSELADAKSYLIGSLPLELASTSDIANVLSSLQRDGLAPSYLTEREKAIKSVSADDVKKLAAQLLDPAKMTTILVGQPEGINVDTLLDSAPGLPAPTDSNR